MPADRPARRGARRAVTIRDMAIAAGVHPSTVSRNFDLHQRTRSTKPPGDEVARGRMVRR
jgi:hypothetical protein